MDLILSTDVIASKLVSQLNDAAQHYTALKHHASSLEGLCHAGVRINTPWACSTLTAALHQAIVNLLPDYNQLATTGSVISLDTIDSRFLTLYDGDDAQPHGGGLLYRLRNDQLPVEDYLAIFAEHYDFEGLAQHLNEQARGLVDRGLREAANVIIKGLDLVASYCMEGRPSFTARAAHFKIQMSYSLSSYDWSDLAELYKLVKATGVAEDDAGFSGLSHALVTAHDHLRSRGYGQQYPSGRKLEIGGVEFTVRNSFLKLSINRDMADSLLAFCKLHGTIAMWDGSKTAA